MSLLCLEPAMRPRSGVRGHAAPERHRGHRERRAAQRLASVSVDSRPGGPGAGDGGAPRPDGGRPSAGRGCGVLIEGESGVGRSRLLEACVVEAKMLGATTLRAGASAGRTAGFAVAQTLAEQLLETLARRCARERARVRRARGPVRNAEAPPTPRRRPRLRALRRSRRAGRPAGKRRCPTGCCTSARPTAWRSRSTTRTRSTSRRPRCSRSWRARRQGHRLLVAATAETGAARGDSAALEVLASVLDEDRACSR